MNKILNKIKLYKNLSKVPFYRNKAIKKLKKYEQRLEFIKQIEQQSDPLNNLQDNMSLLMSANLDILKAKTDSQNKDYNKKFILIIGSLKYESTLSLYSNSILKSIEYKNIVVHFYDIVSRKLVKIQSEAYEQNEDYKELLYYSQLKNLDASMYDISIQVIDSDIEVQVPFKTSKISYAYIIPKEEDFSYAKISNTVNINFDAILYPIEGMDKELYENELLLPKFFIPYSIDLNLYERFVFNYNKKDTRVCFIGNIIDLQPLFKKILSINDFLNKHNIEVVFTYLESNPNFQRTYIENEKQIVSELLAKQTKNIKLYKGFLYLLPPEIFELNKTFDFIIYTEEVENYMYNPIQTISSGKCAVFPLNYKISNSIPNINGIFKYDFKNKDMQIIEIIKKFVIEKESLFLENNIKIRKAVLQYFSKDINSKYYNQLLYPKNLMLGNCNKILEDGIQFKEENLYVKYNYYEKRKEYNIKGDLIPVPIHDAGFGSVLNKYVSLLVYSKENEIYLPDWRIINLARNRYNVFKDHNFWSFCYGKAEDENVFLKIFELPYSEDIVSKELYQSDIMYEKAIKQSFFTEYNIEKEPNLAHMSKSLYKDDYFNEFRKKYHEAYEKYIKLRPEYQNKIDDFSDKYLENKFKIGIHIRCAAHPDESIENIENTNFHKHFEKYNDEILKILKNNSIDVFDQNWVLYIATDNDIALDYFIKRYPNNILYSNDISRLTREEEMEYEKDKMEAGRYLIGYELQQRRSVKDSLRNIKLAEEILFDMQILSKMDYFIFQNSNVPMAVSYMNPKLNMIYLD